jgi:hypothetical protein
LEHFTPDRLFYEDIRKILIKCRVPTTWTYHDVLLLIRWIVSPEMFSAIKTEVNKNYPWTLTYTIPAISFAPGVEVTREHRKTYWALHLAKLFAEASDELTEALPIIKRRLEKKYINNPAGKFLFEQAISNEIAPYFPSSDNELWSKPAKDLTKAGITEKTVEKARARIRKIVT